MRDPTGPGCPPAPPRDLLIILQRYTAAPVDILGIFFLFSPISAGKSSSTKSCLEPEDSEELLPAPIAVDVCHREWCGVGKPLFLGKDEPGCWETLRAQLDVGCGVRARCLRRTWNSLWFAALLDPSSPLRHGAGQDLVLRDLGDGWKCLQEMGEVSSQTWCFGMRAPSGEETIPS